MIDILKNLSLFSNLTSEELQAFLPIIKKCEKSEGQMIFSEGQPGNSLFIIQEGTIEIRKMIDQLTGREKTLATLRGGSFFGEMALYSETGGVRSASAYAASDVICYEIEAQEYHELIRKNPALSSSLSRAIISTLSARLRNTSRELVVLYETGKIVGTHKDADKLSDALIHHLKDSLKAELALIAINNPYAGRIEVKSTIGFDIRINDIDIKPDMGILGKCFSEGRHLLQNSFAEEDAELQALKYPELDIKSLLCVPLLTDAGAIGMILLGDSTPDYYTDSEINLMLGVSRQVATAIENAFFHLEDKARREYQKHFITPGF